MTDPTLSTRPFPADVTCTGVRWGGPPRADGEPSHRATLDLGWPSLTASKGRLHVSMLNPSGASHLASDATITRVVGFARAGGYSGVRITNRFGFRATKPSDMAAAIRRGEDVGEDQDWEEVLAEGSDLVVGWGRPSSALLRRRIQNSTGELVLRWRRHGMRLLALDLLDGWPRHPLMLPSASALREVEWSAAEAGFVWR